MASTPEVPKLSDDALPISDYARAKLQAKNFAYLATIMADGSPQVSPVWVDVRGDHILLNTAQGRIKERNLRRDPRVAMSVPDKDNPYQKIDVRGRVVAWIEGDEAYEHIDAMAKKYVDEDRYPWLAPGEVRVIAVVEAIRINEADG